MGIASGHHVVTALASEHLEASCDIGRPRASIEEIWTTFSVGKGETIENPVRFYLITRMSCRNHGTQRWMVNCDVTLWGHFYAHRELSDWRRSHKADLGTACSLSDSGLWRFTRGCGGIAILTLCWRYAIPIYSIIINYNPLNWITHKNQNKTPTDTKKKYARPIARVFGWSSSRVKQTVLEILNLFVANTDSSLVLA